MNILNKYGYRIGLGVLIALYAALTTADEFKSDYFLKVDSSEAIVPLLNDAEAQFSKGESEQAGAILERALRIDGGSPILWHNLAGVRLQQEDWARAANLAARSNTFAGDDKWLRVRNWVIISLACEGMGDKKCAQEAQHQAQTLADQAGGS